jgi:hypothetical protein
LRRLELLPVLQWARHSTSYRAVPADSAGSLSYLPRAFPNRFFVRGICRLDGATSYGVFMAGVVGCMSFFLLRLILHRLELRQVRGRERNASSLGAGPGGFRRLSAILIFRTSAQAPACAWEGMNCLIALSGARRVSVGRLLSFLLPSSVVQVVCQTQTRALASVWVSTIRRRHVVRSVRTVRRGCRPLLRLSNEGDSVLAPDVVPPSHLPGH